MGALKTHLLALLGALAILGWGLFLWSALRPITAPSERIVTKVEYRDRTVNKIVTQTKTLPGGAVIKTVTQENTKESVRAQSVESVKPRLDRYSLGLGVQVDLSRPLADPVYSIEMGRRLWESPLWGTIGVEYRPRSETVLGDYSVLVGLSYRW